MSETTSSAPVRLVAIPRLAAGGRGHVEAVRSNSEPLLLWFMRGQGRIAAACVTRRSAPHIAIFIPAGVMHRFKVDPQAFGKAVVFQKGVPVPLPARPQQLRIGEPQVHQHLHTMLDTLSREAEGRAPAADRALRHCTGLLSVRLERRVDRHGAQGARPA